MPSTPVDLASASSLTTQTSPKDASPQIDHTPKDSKSPPAADGMVSSASLDALGMLTLAPELPDLHTGLGMTISNAGAEGTTELEAPSISLHSPSEGISDPPTDPLAAELALERLLRRTAVEQYRRLQESFETTPSAPTAAQLSDSMPALKSDDQNHASHLLSPDRHQQRLNQQYLVRFS